MSTTLFNISLLVDKFGNEDGDMLDEIIWDEFNPHDGRNEVSEIEWWEFEFHDLLLGVVRDLVIPLLTPSVKIQLMNTCHNPVRLDVDSDEIDLGLSPEYIEIDNEAIIERARATMKELVKEKS